MTVRVPEPVMIFAEAALSVSVETVALFAPIAKVAAPLIVRAPKVRLLAPSARVPPLTLVAPVYVLAAFKVRVPLPLLVKLPVPLPKLPAREISLPFVSNVPPPVPNVIVLAEGSPVKPPAAAPSCSVPPKNFRVPAPSILRLETCSAP